MERERTPERQWFYIDKLIRDGVWDNYLREGCAVLWRELDDAGFQVALRQKFEEEVKELLDAALDKRVHELADVLSVVSAFTQTGAEDADELLDRYVGLCRAYRISQNDIEAARQDKADKVGEFAGRRFIVALEVASDNPWFVNLSEKFPKLSLDRVQTTQPATTQL